MKIIIVLFVIVTLAGSARVDSRQNSARSRSKSKFLPWPRGELFENFFNVYDPSFLAIAWPKISNGVHITLRRACWKDLSVFFKDLSDGKAWAYRVVDASGRYRAGLFDGNRLWLGSKKKCYQLDEESIQKGNNETFSDFHSDEFLSTAILREKYLGDVSEWRTLVQKDDMMRIKRREMTPPHRLAYTAVNLMLNITKISLAKSYDIILGVCLPRSCTLDDIHSVINFSIILNDNFKSNKTIPRSLRITSLKHVYDHYDIRNDTGALVLIAVTIMLFVVAVLATLFELKLIKCAPRNSKSMSFDLQKFNDLECKNRKSYEDTYCDFRKQSNVIDTETLTINNVENSINLVTVKKVTKPNALPPSITLDVVSMDRVTGSCKRCGKYKKQCAANIRHTDTSKPCPRVKSFASLTEQKEESFFKSLFLCFSLIYSWKRIFNTNTANKELSLVHVLRIIATFWVIYVHVAMIATYASENGADINEHNNAYYILMTGTLAFDTLFFVSGLFSAHHFLYLRRRYSVEELVSFSGRCGQAMQVLCFITNRAIRLLPSYVYVIFIAAVVSRVTSHTSVTSLPSDEGVSCETYWWRNLLYITTAFPEDQQCMQISWYLSVETQLHAIAALGCALITAGHRFITVLLAVAALLAAAADVSRAYFDFGFYVSDVYAAYSVYIERPLARIAPYFIGVTAGWLVHRFDGALSISKTKSCLMWIASCLVILLSVAVPFVTPTWVTSWTHLVWPTALLPLAVLCATHCNVAAVSVSSVVWALSRLSAGSLLLHSAAARLLLLPSDAALCSSSACVWVYFCGVSVLTVVWSLLLSLLVETPACSLLRRLSDYAS